MGFSSSLLLAEGIRQTRMAVSASGRNFGMTNTPSESTSATRPSTDTCTSARGLITWCFAKSLMLRVADGLDMLDGVRWIHLAGETAHKVIGRVTYASGSSEDISYETSSMEKVAYRRRGVLRIPCFGISGRCRLLRSATELVSVCIPRGPAAHTGNRNVNLFIVVCHRRHAQWERMLS